MSDFQQRGNSRIGVVHLRMGEIEPRNKLNNKPQPFKVKNSI